MSASPARAFASPPLPSPTQSGTQSEKLPERLARLRALKALTDRLAANVPDPYASKAQLRTLQRRGKARRVEPAKEMILGSLRKAAVIPAEV